MNEHAKSLSVKSGTILTAMSVFIGSQLMPSGALAETNFNLSSTTANVVATKPGTVSVGGQVSSNGTVSGGTPMSIVSGQMLTPAMNAVLMQSTAGGGQQLLLNQGGAAVGGSANLNSNSSWAGNLSSFVVPAGVTVNAVGFNNSIPLNVSNTANIMGSVYALQTAAGLTGVLNFADNLSIGAGGLLSGHLPANTKLPGLFSSQNLLVNVMGNFSNSGTVSVPGNLHLNVGGDLTNASLSGFSPATLSGQNINLLSGTGNIANSGLIQAVNNINISAATVLADININGNGGTFEALNGSINLRDSSYNGSANINLSGGDYLSKQLNLYTGTGTATVNVGQLEGSLNTVAGAEHVSADTSLLKLGDHCISGDPTYYNTGGIEIVGTLSTAEDLAIIAGGDITSNTDGRIVTNGNDLLMIAGANITSSCSGCTSPGPGTIGTGKPTGLAEGSVKVSLTGSGGDIDLSKSTASTVIDTSSTTGGGGNVTLVALGAPLTFKGVLALNKGSGLGEINSSGTGAAGGGNVTIYAGASFLGLITSISTNKIATISGGASNSGNVVLETTQAVTSDGNELLFNATGNIISGNTVIAGPTLEQAGIETGMIDTHISGGAAAGGNVSLKAYGNINTDIIYTINNGVGVSGGIDLESSNGNISTDGLYSFVYSGWLAAANVNISAMGDITTKDIFTFQGGSGVGGTARLTSSNGSVTTGLVVTGAGDTTAPGNIFISADKSIFLLSAFAGNAGTGGGGTVSLTSSNGAVTAGDIATNTNLGLMPAGNVTISAYGPITILGNINASNSGASSGGAVSLLTQGALLTGDINTSSTGLRGGPITAAAAGNDGSNSIQMGNLNTSGVAAAGSVEIVSLDSAQKPNSLGNITTQASGQDGVGGAVGIATLGTLKVGNIDTSNTSKSANSGASASVFISSGKDLGIFGDSITAGTIKAYNSTNGSATGQVILIASGTISSGTITTLAAGDQSVNQNYSSTTTSISSSTTITTSVAGISGLSSNYNPQGYSSMSGGGSTTLTIDSGSNSSLLAPLLCTDTVSIDSINSSAGAKADSFALASLKSITLSGTTGVNTSGTTSGGNANLLSVTETISVGGVMTNSSGAGAAGNVTLSANGTVIVGGTIDASNSGTGGAGTAVLTSSTGSVTTEDIKTYTSGGSVEAGSVNISASGNISTNGKAITAYNGGTGSGGSLMLTSGIGSISTAKLDSYSSVGAAGSVVLTAYDKLSSQTIAAYSNSGSSGTILLISSNNAVSVGEIDAYVTTGSEAAANITLSSHADLLNGDIKAYNQGSGLGSTVNLLSPTGSVTSGSIDVKVTKDSLAAGNVNIEAEKAIDAGSITAINGATRPIDGGVILKSHTSSITTGPIDISVTGGSAAAGDVNISAPLAITVNGLINASNVGPGAGGKVNIESILSSVTANGIDTSVSNGSAVAGSVSISARTNIVSNGVINTSNAGSGAGGRVFFLSGLGSVSSSGINASATGGSAGTITILAETFINDSGTIDSSNTSGAGGTIALTSGTSSVTTGAIDTHVAGSAPAGNFIVTAPLDIKTAVINTSNLGTGTGGSVALVTSTGSISSSTITSSGTPDGSVFLSSGSAGPGAIVTDVITAGALLATAATTGSITVQPFANGSKLSVDGGQITASGTYTSAVEILPQSYSNSATSTITPATIPAGGFTSFSNSGTVTLANDAGTTGNVITFAKLLPVFVKGTVSSLGTINDSTGQARLLVVASEVSVSSATEYSSTTGSLSILANEMKLASVHTTGVNLNLTAIQNISTGKINTVNSFATLSGNSTLLSLVGSVTTGPIETYIMSGLQSAGNVSISAYGNISTNKNSINTSNSGQGSGGTVNLATSGNGSIETGQIFSGIANTTSDAAAGNVTILAAGLLTTNSQTINASNSGSGAGGTVTLTTETFSVAAGQIDTHATAGSAPAGNVFVSALQDITTGPINAYHHGAGAGGSVALVRSASMKTGDIDTSSTGFVGGSITAASVGDNGKYTLEMGNLNTSGSAAGGSVMLVADDFGTFPTLIGSIKTNASAPGGVGGAVGIAALGTLTVGNIDTTNTAAIASSGAQSGSVFLSSGKNEGLFSDSISVGSINAYNTNGSATGQVILIASGRISSSGTITTSAGTILPQTFIFNTLSGDKTNGYQASVTPFYSSNKLSINSSTTVDVSVEGISKASSNFNPQGYAALSGSSTELTVDAGGNSSLMAPLIFTAYVPMLIKSIKSASSAAADGISLVIFGNLVLSDGFSASGTISGGNIALQSSAGLIFANQIDTHSSGAGSAGSINISAWGVIPVSGKIDAYNSGTGAGGSVFLVSTTDTVLTDEINTYSTGGSAAAGNVIVSSYGAMSTSRLNASNGGMGAGGMVFLTSSNSSVTTGDIDTSSNGSSVAAGNVFISAYGNINTGKIQTYNSSASVSGGAVSLASTGSGGSVVSGQIDTLLTSGSGVAGNLTISSLGSITPGGNINGGTVTLSAEKIALNPGITVSNTVADLLISTSELSNKGAISSSGKIWVFTPAGSDLTIAGTGTMSASATVFGLSPAGGGTVTNQNLFITGNQTITGDLGLFSSASGFSGVVSLSSGSSLSSSTGINIDTPTLLNSGTLTASGTITIPSVVPNPGAVGIFAQNQRASAGIFIGGNGGVWDAVAGGTYIQALFANGIVISGSQTFKGSLTLNDTSNSGFNVDPAASISLSSPATINTSSAVINGTVNFNAGGTINATGDISGSGLLTASSGTLTLKSTGGNIGSSLTPLAVSSGASGVKNLNLDVLATAGTPGNGNVWLTDSDADPGLVGNPAVFLNAVAGTGEGVSNSGTFTMTATKGSIGIHATELRATSKVTLVAERSIIQKHGETISAPVINLTAISGNIGLSETSPTLVSSGSSGSTQLSLTVNAKSNTSGSGNIWISDQDQDISWGVPVPAMLLNASAAGSGTPVDSTTGNFQISTNSGGIAVSGASTASNVLTFNSKNSILSASGSLASPNINLTATTGNIGSATSALAVSSGASGSKTLNLNVVAAANTIGNGNIWLSDSDTDLGPLQPALLLYGVAGSGTAALNSGSFTLTQTGGTIGIHPSILSASSQITLTASQSIIQLHGEVISSPRISLTAVQGNIGVSGALPLIVSSGTMGTALQLTASATNNASGKGNVYLTDPDSDLLTAAAALRLGATSAGSGTAVDATTGNLQISASGGSIALAGAISAKTSIDLSAYTNINQASGSLDSPSMSFTASTGNIGQSTVPLTSNAAKLSANAEGNVFLVASNTAMSLAASSGNTFVLKTTGSNAVSSIAKLNANDITLSSASGSNGSFSFTDIVAGQNSTDASSINIDADGSGTISSAATSSLNTQTLTLNSDTGTIGTYGNGVITDAAFVSANTGNTSGNDGIFIFDSNPVNVTVNTSTSSNWFELVAINNVTVNGPITSGGPGAGGIGALIITNNGDITLNASLITLNTDPSDNGIDIQINNYGRLIQNSGTINSAGSVIVLDAGFGDIGSADKPVSVSGNPPLNLNFATTGNAYFSSPNKLRVFNGIASDMHLTAVGGVTISGLTTVNNLTVEATGGGDVLFNANGSLTLLNNTGDASSVLVKVNGNATISTGVPGDDFILNANSLTLISANGDIGSSANPIKTTASFLSVSTLAQAFIDDTNTKTVTLSNSSASDLFLTSSGGINSSGSLNVSGTTSLVANNKNITYSGGSANIINLQAPLGTINLPTAILAAIPDASGAGGTITLIASALSYPGSNTFTPLVLDASGLGSGNGGTISVTLNSAKPLLINSTITGKNPPPTQVMALDARSGSGGGNAGTVSVSTGGNLTVFPSSLNTAGVNGDGANITLQAGANLLINGPLNANAAGSGNGGSITLRSNSATQFTIGATGTTNTNAVLKSTTAASTPVLSVLGTTGKLNGSISVSNLGGSLTNLVPLTAVDTLTLTSGAAGSVLVKNPLGSASSSTISLSTTGSGKITSTTQKIQSLTLNLTSAGGTIGTATVPLQFIATNTNANAGSATGVVNLTNQTTGSITLGASSAGKSFKLTAPKATTIGNSATLLSPTVIISAAAGSVGTTGSHLKLNSGVAGTITITAKGSVFADNLSTSASTLNKSSGKDFTFTAAGDLTLKGITTTNGAIDVQTSTGLLQTAPSAVISTKSGSITLTNTDNTSAGSIVFGKASRVATNGPTGNLFPVTITVGTGGTVSPVNPLPTTIRVVTTTGGQALFSPAGTPGLSAVAPINTINLKGSDVTLNSGANGSIKLNGSVVLTADPVAPATAIAGSTVARSASTPAGSGTTGAGTVAGSGVATAGLKGSSSLEGRWLPAGLGEAAFALASSSSSTARVTPTHAQVIESTKRTAIFVGDNPQSEPTRQASSGSAKFSWNESGFSSSAGLKRVSRLKLVEKGSVLFAPSVDTVVETEFGQIKIDAGSVALVMKFTHGIATYDLHDSHRSGVVVKAAGQEIVLSPGKQVIVSSDTSNDFQKINPAESFAYRGIEEFGLGQGLKAITAEFSIGRAVALVEPIKQLNCQSSRTRKLLANILKNAAIIQQMHSSKGRFEQYAHPRST